VENDSALAQGVNTVSGKVTNPAVAQALDVEPVDPRQALAK
jgi:alanine dehydrogenase